LHGAWDSRDSGPSWNLKNFLLTKSINRCTIIYRMSKQKALSLQAAKKIGTVLWIPDFVIGQYIKFKLEK